MSAITTILGTDVISTSRTDINTNFSNLNSGKMETSVLDTDTTLAANSDLKVATQKATKAYVDAGGNVNASETSKGISQEATDAQVTAGTATGSTGAKLFVTPAKLLTRTNTIVAALVAALVTPGPNQIIPLAAGTTVNTYVQMTHDSNGATLYIATYIAATIRLYCLTKDTTTLNYYISASTSISMTGTDGLKGLTVLGNYLYVGFCDNNVGKLNRYDKATLANVQAMTISGTSSFAGANTTMWADGTYLWVLNTAGVADVFRNYSVSGTTATSVGTTTFTSAGIAVAATSDNTNVWITNVSDGTVNIRKYPVAGGAAVSTTSPIIVTSANPHGVGLGFFLAASNKLGIGWIYTLETNTAVNGTATQLTAITLP